MKSILHGFFCAALCFVAAYSWTLAVYGFGYVVLGVKMGGAADDMLGWMFLAFILITVYLQLCEDKAARERAEEDEDKEF